MRINKDFKCRKLGMSPKRSCSSEDKQEVFEVRQGGYLRRKELPVE